MSAGPDRPTWTRDGAYVGPRTLIRLWSYLDAPEDVPFSAVVRAQRQLVAAAAVTAGDAGSERARDETTYLYRELRTAFGRANGRIVHEYYCRDAVAAAVLTDAFGSNGDGPPPPHVPARALHTVLNSTDELLQGLESQCDVLVNDSVAVFAGEKNRRQLAFAFPEGAYHAMASVLYVADSVAGGSLAEDSRSRPAPAAAKRVQATVDQVQVLIQRHARFSYFCGVLIGSVVALLLCTLVGCLSAAYWNTLLSTPSIVIAMVMGVFGSVTSVFQRISSGQLVLDYTAPRSQRLILGGLRPFIGALFGAVVYFAIGAGLVAAAGQPQGDVPTASIGFFAVLGFIAGFSERFATDMLERAGKLLVPLSQGPERTVDSNPT